MQLHTLKSKTKRKISRQVGRGGTRGKTAGRGTKGQNARAGRKKRPELRDFIKRFPKLRGRGVSSFKSHVEKPLAVNLDRIETLFSANETVNIESLIEKKIIVAKKGSPSKVKILGTGLSKKLTFENVSVSASARKEIEALGGEVR